MELKYENRKHSGWFLLSHKRLLLNIALSELKSRYAGSFLGLGWAVVYPLAMLSIYTMVYLFIFNIRSNYMTKTDYVFYIFSGMLPILMTTEALMMGTVSVADNKAALSNTVFPIDLAPAKALLLSQTSMIVGYTIILLLMAVLGRLTWTIIFIPFFWTLLAMMLLGLLWVSSLVHLVFRDIQWLVNLCNMVLMVASPIAYTPEMVPSSLQFLFYLNPFALFVMSLQQVVVLGRLPSWHHIAYLTVIACSMFFLGGYFFSRAKNAMLDHA
ncbi:MAG: ABC transporter permease [Humidesulfovibrio sp.]|nr:ABC transporter permease [Humidesulfovibrio sp.]